MASEQRLRSRQARMYTKDTLIHLNLLTYSRRTWRNLPRLHTERKETHNGWSRQLLSSVHNWV